MLWRVWEATCPRLSPVIIARCPRCLAILAARRSEKSLRRSGAYLPSSRPTRILRGQHGTTIRLVLPKYVVNALANLIILSTLGSS